MEELGQDFLDACYLSPSSGQDLFDTCRAPDSPAFLTDVIWASWEIESESSHYREKEAASGLPCSLGIFLPSPQCREMALGRHAL